MHCTLQKRDGFESQVESLRDKVSKLARDLAAGEEGAEAASARGITLEQSLAEAQAALERARSDGDATAAALAQAQAEGEGLAAQLTAAQEELAQANLSHGEALQRAEEVRAPHTVLCCSAGKCVKPPTYGTVACRRPDGDARPLSAVRCLCACGGQTKLGVGNRLWS